MSRPLISLFTVALCLLSATAQSAKTHDYTVTVGTDLSRLQVRAQFAAAVTSIAARDNSAGDFLLAAEECDDETRIRNRGRRLLIDGNGVTCIEYEVDLGLAARAERRNATLAETNIIASPAAWLWRPGIDSDTELRVTFVLPDNVQVAVPWPRETNNASTYRITASPENAAAAAAFGRFEQTTIRVAQAKLDVTVLRSSHPARASEIVRWVETTANQLVLAYGRFPNATAHVFIIPVGARADADEPFLFGRVIRDGGEVIEFHINELIPIDDYYGHWTATHEFSHLLLPYVYTRHRWISEGFAQYLQNVLLARSGVYSEQRAWQNLYDGFVRGQTSSPGLSPNEAAVADGRGGTMKIYWSGAALALMADVELRRRSDGRESLDTVLDRLQQCCLPSARSWDGVQLLEKMDSLIETPVFVPIYRAMADAPGFPDVSALLESLGLEISHSSVTLNNSAEFAHVRAAITAPPVATATDSQPH